MRRVVCLFVLMVMSLQSHGLEYPLQVGTQIIFDVTTAAMGQYPQRGRYELWVLGERESAEDQGGMEAVWMNFVGVGTPQETMIGAIRLVIFKNGVKKFPMERWQTADLHMQVEALVPTLPAAFNTVWKGPASIHGWYYSYQPVGRKGNYLRMAFAQYATNRMDEVVGTQTTGEVLFDPQTNWLKEVVFSTQVMGPQGMQPVITATMRQTRVVQRDAAWAQERREESRVFFTNLRNHDIGLLQSGDNINSTTLEIGNLITLWQNYLATNETSRFRDLAKNQFEALKMSIPALQQNWVMRKQKIGTPSPMWTLNDTAGGTYSLAGIKDQPILLFFWSRSMWWSLIGLKDLQTIKATYEPKGLLIFPINLDASDQDADAAMKIMGLPFVSLRCMDPNLLQAYGIPYGAIPTTVLLDRGKKIADVRFGWGKDTYEEVMKRVQGLF